MFARTGVILVVLVGLSGLFVSGARAGFGVRPGSFSSSALNGDGTFDTQAGSHPYAYNVSFAFNRDSEGKLEGKVHNIVVNLPPGLVGNPTAVARCPEGDFESGILSACPGDTQVGVLYIEESGGVGRLGPAPVFNLVPPVGVAARFGVSIAGFDVFEDASVRTGAGYGVRITTNNVPVEGLESVSETIWGIPADKGHDPERQCVGMSASGPFQISGCPSTATPQPFLTLPTSCEGPLVSTLDVLSRGGEEAEASAVSVDGGGNPAGLAGCERLPFDPFITVAPDSQAASTPSGLTVHVKVPQTSALNIEGLAGADVRNTTVALPVGVSINPAGADGLAACSEAQIGYLPEASSSLGERFTSGEQSCPDASKVATARITTPLLPNSLEGAVYLAEPAPNGEAGKNPFDSLIALYIVARDPVSGVLVKLPGQVRLDQVTGQLVSTFLDTPPVPFEDLELHFFGGERAPLGTPSACGTYTTTAAFTPWSTSTPFDSSSAFQVLTGHDGGACLDPLPFSPSLAAGMTSIQAGGFSPFTMTMGREDGNQNLKAIQLHMPSGLSGDLTGVKLCGEPEADQGTCGPESLIGETTVSVGLGSDPFTVTGGKVYMTGPYEGAPFGLSIVNPAKAGPFDLGHVIVRARVEVDPHTADLTITSDSQGPYAIPPSIDGIPLQIKHVNVTITRKGFTFNPTSCDPEAITGTLRSVEGGSWSVGIPFQVTNCASLKFKPGFKVSTSGKTSRKDGASLNVKLSYLSLPRGSQADIAKVKVDLPRQLPSNLKTLQQACSAEQFARNPAGCPAASIVGFAKATTPILPVPLQGPAYFVSHGGEAFPNLIIVLQGYGVTVDLVGDTFISKKSETTSSTFSTVPDVPVGTFELNLPEGPYSALDAPTNLCKAKQLKMPTLFIAQDGTEIKQSTPITTTGCPKTKKKPKKTVKHKK